LSIFSSNRGSLIANPRKLDLILSASLVYEPGRAVPGVLVPT
jgi:hypothetical protein